MWLGVSGEACFISIHSHDDHHDANTRATASTKTPRLLKGAIKFEVENKRKSYSFITASQIALVDAGYGEL